MVKRIFKNLVNNKRIMYLLSICTLLVFCLILNITFSLFTTSTNKEGVNIKIGELSYVFDINSEYDDLKSNIYNDRVIKVEANTTKVYYLNLTSENKYDTKYQIVYKYCSSYNESTNKCTIGENSAANVEFYYSEDTLDSINGIISSNGSKAIKIVVINKTSNDYFYELGINAGYIHNELNINNNNYSGLAITEGYAIPDGTVKLVSYVDGVQTEGGSFPTTGYYSADVTCQLADGTYDYEIGHARWDGTKWLIKIDYAPQDTICNAIFTTNNNPYPIFTYTCSDGTDCTNDVTKVKLIEDGDGNWRIVFKASGTFRTTYPEANAIDIFLVGGGGGGSAGNYWSNYASGSGGGGGYTKTYSIADANNNVLITINSNTEYSVTIGAGGAAGSSNHANGSAGGNSSFGTYSVNGAAATTTSGVYCTGGNGGSGGGGSIMYNQTGGVGGYNGGAGESLGYVTGGTGQGSNTCEFGEYVGTSCKVGGACTCKYSTSNGYEAAVLDIGMYAGGGGAGSGSAAGGAGGGGNGASDGGKGVAGKANTGGGGGGGSTNKTSSGTAGGKGGSGVVIIRNHM